MAKKKVKKTAKKVVKHKKAARYACGVCGLAVRVDELCGCMEAHEIICCGKAMKPRK